MRWSSGFLWSSWTTLWSMYWTARPTLTRGTPSCSNCMNAIVPVASWSSVWSMRSAIGSPGLSSPSTRWSARIRRDSESATSCGLPRPGARHHTTLLVAQRGVRRRRLHHDERPDRRGGANLERAVEGRGPSRFSRERERFEQRRGEDARMGAPVGALVVLLDEEAPAHDAVVAALGLEAETEHVRQPASEAQLVVGGAHRRAPRRRSRRARPRSWTSRR